MKDIIEEALRLGLWSQLDIHLACMLVKPNEDNGLTLAILTLSAYINRGHVCLPLIMLSPNHLFYGSYCSLAYQAWEKAGSLSFDHWQRLLASSSIVSDGSFLAPLILDKERLYLYRMWNDECLIATFFRSSSQELSSISEKKTNQIITLLNQFFPTINHDKSKYNIEDNNVDWQKVAIALVLIRRVTIISGGPGTGKTSIISKLLMTILSLDTETPLIIKMAAPTGKAVARLNESIDNLMFKQFCLDNNKNSYERHNLSIEVITLHRLLHSYFNSKQTNIVSCVQYNFLCLDYLIIDECSMVDLSMMAKIMKILPYKTKVVLLGDHKQLPSVESGSVFSDLCYFIGKGYTENLCQQLKKLTGCILPIRKDNKYYFNNNLCLLRKNYRFNPFSTIGRLASSVSIGDYSGVLSLLTSQKNDKDLHYITLNNHQDYFKMLINCAFGYSNYFNNLIYYNYKNLPRILNFFNKYRLLCVLREGPFGVSRLNVLIENILNDNQLIHLVDNRHYVGKPIIITSNDSSLSLFNGEIGIILPDDDNSRLYAYFLSSGGNIKKISLHKLPKYDTALVMTIHKSQGSEFEHTVLIFPNEIMPILTRELIYTGITRARKCLSIYATDQIISYGVNNPYKRYSGLIDRLK